MSEEDQENLDEHNPDEHGCISLFSVPRKDRNSQDPRIEECPVPCMYDFDDPKG
jgi:hypothetical protein